MSSDTTYQEQTFNEWAAQQAFDTAASTLRISLKHSGEHIKHLMQHPVFSANPHHGGTDSGEMKANIMLAYRHLEDAAMRLGKAIQAFDGGKSVYDETDRAPSTRP